MSVHASAPYAASVILRVGTPLTAASAAVAVSAAVPVLGPLLLALLLGAVVANTAGASRLVAGQAEITKVLLRLGVMLLGLRLSLADVAGIGLRGAVVIGATVAATYTATRWLGARAGLDERFVELVAAGFSICVAAAIAAINDAVRAKERDVALAVGLVTVFGSAMIMMVPWLSAVLSLNGEQAAIWVGASIHEVAQVVAAASLLGAGAVGVAVATTVKLGRVALLAPTYALAARKGSGRREGADGGVPVIPWFLTGFVVMVALRSLGVVPDGMLMITDLATTLLLAAGMFGLGLGLRARELWPMSASAFGLALIATAVAAGVSLVLIASLY